MSFRFNKLIGFVVVAMLLLVTVGSLGNQASAAEIKYINYTVQSGETLDNIAYKYQIGKDEIVAVNPKLQTNDTVTTGQVIVIPDLSEIKALQNQVVSLINNERQKAGLAPLTNNWQLSRVARFKSNDMRDNNYFSHYSPTYGDPFVMMRDFGISFSTAGENIAAKQSTPAQVVSDWMNSDSHKANILNPKYTQTGVGYAEGGMLGYYWTQMFIAP